MGKSSNNRRNRKLREEAAFREMMDVRDGYRQPDSAPRRSPELELQVQPQNQDQYTADGALIIAIDDDLEVPELSLADLPKARGYVSESGDVERSYQWLLQWELASNGSRLDAMTTKEILHARSHEEAESVVRRFQALARNSEGTLVIGLDTEGMEEKRNPVTLQLSAAVAGQRVNAVVQLRSNSRSISPAHVFQEGPPLELRKIFEIPNAIFVGKSVAEDVIGTTDMLGIPRDEANGLLVIDTDRLFNLADALARGPEAIEAWKGSARATGLLGEVSLKNFAQFTEPLKIMDKSPSHRNHNANFIEEKRPMSARDLCYAALDARRASEAVEKFAEIMGVKGEHLASSIESPADLNSIIFSSMLNRISQVYDKPPRDVTATIDAMPREFAELFSKIHDSIPTFTRLMAKAQKKILEFLALKKMSKRILTVARKKEKNKEKNKERIGKVYEIQKREPSALRIYPPSQPPLQSRPSKAVDGDHDDDEVMPDDLQVVDETGGSADENSDDEVTEIAPTDVIDEPTDATTEETTTTSEGESGEEGGVENVVEPEITINPKPKQIRVTITNNTEEHPDVFFPAVVSYPSLPSRSSAPALPSLPPRSLSSLPPQVAGPSSVPAARAAERRSHNVESAKARSIREYDERMASMVYYRLRVAEECDHLEILREFEAPTEKQSINRCVLILRHFAEHGKKRWKMVPLARTMMTMFPTQVRAFVDAIFREEVMGKNRLKIAVELDHFLLSPMIILAELFINPPNLENVKKAVLAFPAAEVMKVVKFLARNAEDPRAIHAEMVKVDCFRENFEVKWRALKWHATKVREFVETVCATVDAEIPAEAQPFILRSRLDKAFSSYRAGETEIEDLYKICLMIADDDDDVFEKIMEYFAERSNPIAEFFSSAKGRRFKANPKAGDSLPSCAMPTTQRLHGLASPSNTIIRGDDSSEVLERCIKESDHFAIGLHRSAEFVGRGVVFVFRFCDHSVFYLPEHSRRQRARITTILGRHVGDKKVFLLQRDLVLDFCHEQFSWAPAQVVDARALAEKQKVTATYGGLARSLVDSTYCRRARNFAASAVPSKICLLHRDIDVSLVYEFCIDALGLKMKDRRGVFESRQARKRERLSSSDGSDSRSRSRNK